MSKKLKYPHFEDCKCGSGGHRLPKAHPWWVKASNYDNCFWTYLRHNDRPHSLQEIGNLLDLSISAVTSSEKKALNKLKKKNVLLSYNKD